MGHQVPAVQHVENANRAQAAPEVRRSTVPRRISAALILGEQGEEEGRLPLRRRGRGNAALAAHVHFVVADREHQRNGMALGRDQRLRDVLEPRPPTRPPRNEAVGVGEVAADRQQVRRPPRRLGQQRQREGFGAHVAASRQPHRTLLGHGAEAARGPGRPPVQEDVEVVPTARLQAAQRKPVDVHVRNAVDPERFARDRLRLAVGAGRPPFDACRPRQPFAEPIRLDDQVDGHRRRRVALPREVDRVPGRRRRRAGASPDDEDCEGHCR